MSVQTQANGIQETLCSASPFTVPSSIDLFLFLSKSLSSMSNPLWCSHVCWSCARVAWDYHGWRHTHICTRTCTHGLYILFQISPSTMWGTAGMCRGTSVLTVEGLSGLEGIFCMALGQGNLSFLLP